MVLSRHRRSSVGGLGGRGADGGAARPTSTYDAALTRIVCSQDQTELRAATAVLDGLGARATASAGRHQMKALGMPVPRGPRTAARAAPAGLTAREQEVLTLLSQGLRDREISRDCSSRNGPCTTTSPRCWPRSASRPGPRPR